VDTSQQGRGLGRDGTRSKAISELSPFLGAIATPTNVDLSHFASGRQEIYAEKGEELGMKDKKGQRSS
jgi:hypothetical protein